MQKIQVVCGLLFVGVLGIEGVFGVNYIDLFDTNFSDSQLQGAYYSNVVKKEYLLTTNVTYTVLDHMNKKTDCSFWFWRPVVLTHNNRMIFSEGRTNGFLSS